MSAVCLPFTGRVTRPLPVLHTVPPPCGQCYSRSATVGRARPHRSLRQVAVLQTLVYRAAIAGAVLLPLVPLALGIALPLGLICCMYCFTTGVPWVYVLLYYWTSFALCCFTTGPHLLCVALLPGLICCMFQHFSRYINDGTILHICEQ